VLSLELGGGVDTLDPTDGSVGEGGMLPAAAEETKQFFVTASYAYPSGHVHVG
jgi:hypothetical protein